MAQTFDIRFARSAGLAAMLEAPSNSFHWTGTGSLSIDAQGISVAVKRSLLSLLAGKRTRRIPAADLKEVFREGEALRVEFATDNTARASLRFWANDRDTAAHIVRLLPTSRTVELEDSAAVGGYRVNRRIAAGLGLALAAIAGVIATISLDNPRLTIGTGVASGVAADSGAAAFGLVPGESGAGNTKASVDSPKPLSATAAKLPATDAVPARPARAREIVIPVYPGRMASTSPPTGTSRSGSPVMDASAPVTLETLERLAPSPAATPAPLIFRVRVTADGVVPLVAGMAGYAAARREIAIFALESEGRTWWEMTARIHNSADFDDPALWPLRDAELAASRAWRNYDESYRGSGLDNESAELEFAQKLTARVYQFVD